MRQLALGPPRTFFLRDDHSSLTHRTLCARHGPGRGVKTQKNSPVMKHIFQNAASDGKLSSGRSPSGCISELCWKKYKSFTPTTLFKCLLLQGLRLNTTLRCGPTHTTRRVQLPKCLFMLLLCFSKPSYQQSMQSERSMQTPGVIHLLLNELLPSPFSKVHTYKAVFFHPVCKITLITSPFFTFIPFQCHLSGLGQSFWCIVFS